MRGRIAARSCRGTSATFYNPRYCPPAPRRPGQTVRCDHQCDHHLRTVRPFVAAVTVAALVALGHVRGVDLEIGAGQIVEQHVEADVEQIAPARHQMREQIRFVRQQKIMTGVKLVRLGQTEIRTEQIGHGAAAEPVTVQFPLAARRDQPVRHQHLQDLIPPRALAVDRQTLGPEAIQLQLFPQLPGQPACTPLPWSAQPHLRQAKLHGRTVGRHRGTAILGKQRQRPRMSGFLVENLDGLAPRGRLGWADLTQIQNVALHHPAALQALVLDDAPIAVRLAILLSPGLPQKHDPASLAKRISPRERGRSSLQPFSAVVARYSRGIPYTYQTASGPKPGFSGSNPRRRASVRNPQADILGKSKKPPSAIGSRRVFLEPMMRGD